MSMRAYGNAMLIDRTSWGIEDRTGITVIGYQQLRCVSGGHLAFIGHMTTLHVQHVQCALDNNGCLITVKGQRECRSYAHNASKAEAV